jgi:hypothetical protein
MPQFFCPCCRKTYPAGAHSQIECAKDYLGRVLPFLGDLSAKEIGNLPHLQGFPKASIVRIIPTSDDRVIGATLTNSSVGVHVGFNYETISAEDRREHEDWIRMIAQRKEAVNLIRGRV